jgi:hypothetical protein
LRSGVVITRAASGGQSATVSSESLRALLRLRDFDGRLRINT